jgi:hypothetical protein
MSGAPFSRRKVPIPSYGLVVFEPTSPALLEELE